MEVDAKFDQTVIALITQSVPGKSKKTQITAQTHLQKELGLDSIGILALVFRFEELFGVDIGQMGIDVDIAKLKTVGDVLHAGREIMSKAQATTKLS
jgi:acyl carrier protein